MKSVAVIVPVHNRREITISFIQQFTPLALQLDEYNFELIIVDDGSTDGTSEEINKQFPDVIVLHGNGNLWWTGAINMGVEYAISNNYDYTLLLNDDLELDSQFLSIMLKVAMKNSNSLVSALKVVRGEPNDRIVTSVFEVTGKYQELIDHNAGKFVKNLDDQQIIEGDALTGAALLVSISTYRDIGILDFKRFPHNWGDFEFTLRASKAGYPCLLAVQARVYTDKNNPNYHYRYLVESSRVDYLRNLFNRDKYTYGFDRLWHMSTMHKPRIIALRLFVRRLLGEFRWIILKIILPKYVLKGLVSNYTH